MRKHTTYVVAGVTLAASLALPGAVAGAAGADEEMEVNETLMTVSQIDVGKKGMSQGDSIVYRSVIRDADGDKIGRGGGECVSVRPKAGTLGLTTCDASLELKRGQLIYAGFYDATKKQGVMPLVGGTGEYRGVTGAVSWAAKSDTVFDLEIRFED